MPKDTAYIDRRSRAFDEYGLRRIVNASGTETPRGGSPVCPEVIEAVADLVGNWVDMLELQSVACAVIAKAFGTEGGCVVNCTAAGMATAIAACMTGTDMGRVEQLPDTTGMKRDVVLQRGHNITYGGLISQNVAITGARVVEIGLATECGAYQLEHSITDQTAAALYVVSHHTAPSGLIDIETFCAVCKRRGIPVIVDGATEPDPRKFLRAGADLVVTSMHKSFAGITGATVAGRLDLIRACIFQEKGIARPMKVGKEGVIGAIAAVRRWTHLDHPSLRQTLDNRLTKGRDRLGALRGLVVWIEPDATSFEFSRLLVKIDPATADIDAYQLSAQLARQDPSIAVRNLMADIGILQIDLRFIDDTTADYIFDSIELILKDPKRLSSTAGIKSPRPNLADLAVENLRRFPLSMKSL